MKRIVAGLLTLVLIAGSMSTAFASPGGNWKASKQSARNWSKAHVLYQMGLFKGKSSSAFLPALEDGSNRAEAIVLIGRAMGWPVDNNITSIPEYPDVPSYAAPYVRYALDQGITRGIGHKRFGAALPVNARMVYTWYARALQYTEDVWSDPSLLVRLGMLSQSQADRLSTITDDATRDLLVEIIFDSMNWRIRGSDMRLVQRLARELWINIKAAEDAGLLNPEAKTMGFTATAVTQKSIRLSFNQVLDLSTVMASNLEIKAGTQGLTGYTVTAAEKEIFLTFQDAIAAGTTLFIKALPALKSVTGLSTDGKTRVLRMGSDEVAPSILDVSAGSPTVLQFTFSEPIVSTVNEIAAHVSVNGSLATGVYAFNGTNTVLTLTLQGASVLVEGTNKIQVKAGIRDLSGMTTTAYEKNITVSVDKTPPTAMVTTQPGFVLQVQFSEPVDGFSSSSVALRGTDSLGAAFTPAVSEIVYQEQTYVGLIRLVPASLPEGSATMEITLRSGIRDTSVNRNPLEETVKVVSIKKDTTAPLATVTTEAGFVMRIAFSEPVDGFSTTDFVLTGKDENDVAIQFSEDSLTVVFDTALTGASITVKEEALPAGRNVLSLQLLSTILDKAEPANALVALTNQVVFEKITAEP